MKIVINECYGGFGLNKNFANTHNLDPYDESIKMRTNSELISAIEKGEKVGEEYSELTVVEIPNETTDYEILTQDGYEELIYVLNGKIYWAE